MLDAKLVENEVWARVCDMVGNAEQLKHPAAHQLEKHAGEQVDYGRRIEEFQKQIEDSEAAIAVATAAAARQAARRGLAGKAAEQAIDRTLAPLMASWRKPSACWPRRSPGSTKPKRLHSVIRTSAPWRR
ncbi:hypothetical protein ACFQ0Q_32715 [Streptomyces aureus]